jgi:hypothetical protein
MLSRFWHTDLDYGSYSLPDLEIELKAGKTGRQGMLTPSRHLIPPLVNPGVHVCSIPWSVFPTGLMGLLTVWYLNHFFSTKVYKEKWKRRSREKDVTVTVLSATLRSNDCRSDFDKWLGKFKINLTIHIKMQTREIPGYGRVRVESGAWEESAFSVDRSHPPRAQYQVKGIV